jgi:hypothetical protein
VAKVSEATGSLVERAHKGQGLGANEGYGAGDLTKGVADRAGEAVGNILTEGKLARDADPDSSYHFGDVTRGLIATVARR